MKNNIEKEVLKNIKEAAKLIEEADNRCMARDGPILPTDSEMSPKSRQKCYEAIWKTYLLLKK